MKITMIGTRGIPARYGGFETAAEEIGTRLTERGHDVTVYNRTPDNAYSQPSYRGVRIVSLPTLRSKNLGTIVHSLLCTLHALRSDAEIVHYFTAGAGALSFLPRLFGKRTVCSVDGLDWSRRKWGRLAKTYLLLAERLVVEFTQGVITDSQVGEEYYLKKYGRQTTMIAYGASGLKVQGDEWLERLGLRRRGYVLFVGRLVPEKNVHQLVEAFEGMETDLKLVVVGDDPWEKEYVAALKQHANERIIFTGYLYGDGYAVLQTNAYVFVLPAEVGGRSPVLLEAMGYGNCVLVSDTPSNLEAIGDAGVSYDYKEGAPDLRRELEWLIAHPQEVADYRQRAEAKANKEYRWDDIVDSHEALYRELLGLSSQETEALHLVALDTTKT